MNNHYCITLLFQHNVDRWFISPLNCFVCWCLLWLAIRYGLFSYVKPNECPIIVGIASRRLYTVIPKQLLVSINNAQIRINLRQSQFRKSINCAIHYFPNSIKCTNKINVINLRHTRQCIYCIYVHEYDTLYNQIHNGKLTCLQK